MKNNLKISNLKKNYHSLTKEVIALDDFSLVLKDKEFVSIVGPSGCGKSTILSILCNLESSSGGSFKIYNGKSIGYMLQDDCLLDYRTILENCLLGLEINNTLNIDNKKFVVDLLNKYGLSSFASSKPSSLSGGMRQRVA